MGTKEAPYLTHYRSLVRAYFADQTEEGRIAKYAKMAECAYMRKMRQKRFILMSIRVLPRKGNENGMLLVY